MDQKRLLLAFVLSAVILFGWAYLFPPPAPEQQNANSAQPAATGSSAQAPSQQTAQADASQPVLTTPSTPDTVPQRIVTVTSPLYKVQFDSRGATVKSW